MKNTFGKDIIPGNEEERLKAVNRYRIVQDLPGGYFSKLAYIVANTFKTSIALISLVDKEDVFFIGNAGMEDTGYTPRGVSLCSLAILDDQPTVFNNALHEPCLLANPLVVGNFGLRFYAGAPIVTNDGFAIGTVCVVDKEPREFSAGEQEILKGFAETAMRDIELRVDLLSIR